MPKLPFATLPSAPPPGSSHFISNAIIIAKRVALNLEDPVRIHAGEWEEDHPVVHWYRRHRDSKIRCMQLRKEQKAPFFHEYITFRLDNGRCFRLDRRQLPDERSPMDCAEAKGVEAYDTIEQITSLEDSMYNPSDSLAQLDFEEGVSPGIFLMVLPPISSHSQARVYTVQRYNCYFYAQTVLLCTLCANSGWDQEYLWRGEEWNADGAETLIGQMPLIELEKNPGTNIKLLVNQPEIEIPSMQTSGLTDPNQELTPPTERATVWGTALQFIWDKRKGSHSGAMQESTIGELQSYIWRMIHAHSIRVEQYKFLLRCSARDVERDIKTVMNEVWHQVMRVRIQFDGDRQPSDPLFDWYKRHRTTRITTMQLREERNPPLFRQYVAFRLSNDFGFRVDRRPMPVQPGVEPYDTIEQIADLEDSMYYPSRCLIQLNFRVHFTLIDLLDILQAIAYHRWASTYTNEQSNCCFYAQTIINCTCALEAYECRGEGELWRADGLSGHHLYKFVSEQERLVEIRIMDERPVPKLRFRPDGRGSDDVDSSARDELKGTRPSALQVPKMERSTYIGVKRYLSDLIREHCVRVGKYEFPLNSTGRNVEQDIKTAMNEIWSQLAKSPIFSMERLGK